MNEHTTLRHTWNDDVTRIAACDTDSGNGETIRTCERCKMIMITIHPPTGFPWHEFTMPGSTARIALSQRPPCVSQAVEVKT